MYLEFLLVKGWVHKSVFPPPGDLRTRHPAQHLHRRQRTHRVQDQFKKSFSYIGPAMSYIGVRAGAELEYFKAVLGIRIRIRRIRMFLGLPDPDHCQSTDPDLATDPSLFS